MIFFMWIEIKKMARAIMKFIEDAPILPVFVFKDANGQIYGGTLKEEYLSEPIAAYYFKHQNKWLEDISIIALKGPSSPQNVYGDNHLTNVVSPYFEIISQIIFLENTIKISPVAVLRRV